MNALLNFIKCLSHINSGHNVGFLLLTIEITLVHVFSSIQFLSHVQLFVTPWTAACQASLSITNSWSLFKLMSIESGDAIQPFHKVPNNTVTRREEHGCHLRNAKLIGVPQINSR